MNAKIMLVDDSRSFLAGLSEVVLAAGFEVSCYTSPADALFHLERENPDLIICDIHMPGMDGFEFITELRTRFSMLAIPVLALTGDTETAMMERAIDAGADAFSAKETIRYTVTPQIKSLLRLKDTHVAAAKGKQLDAVHALIRTYKHEFNNALAIMDGSINKLKKTCPGAAEHPSMAKIDAMYERIRATIKKLEELREYSEEQYSEQEKMLKIG